MILIGSKFFNLAELFKKAHVMKLATISILTAVLFSSSGSLARDHGGGGGPPTRAHTAITTKPVKFEPPNIELDMPSRVSIEIDDDERIIKSNGIPNHLVGRFPNCGNPHQIGEQNFRFEVTTKPSKSWRPSELDSGWAFGVAVNGVPFEPLAAEWWKGYRDSEWRYEALSGAVPLGPDESQAHVQPGGKYHYHGLPMGLLEKEGISNTSHSKIIGWAADGFPIYALYGFADKKSAAGGIKEFKSSFKLKTGERPGGWNSPKGVYDGAFIADYEYVENSGDLDKCNGMDTATPDFPNGTYAYFLTSDWPIIPRCFIGSPDSSFNMRGSGGPPGKPGRKPADCPRRGGMGPGHGPGGHGHGPGHRPPPR